MFRADGYSLAYREKKMPGEGKYIYCVIETNEERNFGPIGIGEHGDEVVTICYGDLSAVISSTAIVKHPLTRQNLLAHEKVIETVMREHTVLPVRFCTIASSAEEVRDILGRRRTEFKGLFQDMDNKIELGVRAFWKDMPTIFQEIVEENKEIKSLKQRIVAKALPEVHPDRSRIGRMVESALNAKKQKEGEEIVSVLKRSSADFRTNRVLGDKMLLNAAFLVDRGREKEFDNRVDQLTTRYGNRVQFKYVGPAPPYNFVNIVID